MWLKLYFRHLFTSIRRMPLQPLLSSLVLALAFFIAAAAFMVGNAMVSEAEFEQRALYGNADISVSINSRSESRFLQTGDAYSVLGGKITAAGSYRLPAMRNGRTVTAVSTDFEDICGIFTLEFTSYGKVTETSQDGAAFITQDFAAEHRLDTGDALEVQLLGHTASYTVQGISPYKFMGECDMMISRGSVLRLLAADSPFIAALGDDFELYSRLYIDVGGADAEECAELLAKSPAFADKTVSLVTDIVSSTSNLQTMPSVIFIFVTFVAAVAAAVVFCCLYILSSRRAGENSLFAAAGARPQALLFLQCGEIILYWLAGGAAGAALTAALATPLFAACGFIYSSPFAGFALNCLKALGITLITSLLTAVVFYAAERAGSAARTAGRRAWIPAAALLGAGFAICAVCAFAAPVNTHLAFGVAGCLLLLLLAFLCVPHIMRAATEKIAAKEPPRTPSPYRAAALYAAKNARSVKTLHNSARLIAVIFSCAAVLALVIISGYSYKDARENMLSADYLLINAGSAAAENVAECEGVESAVPIYIGTATDERGNSVTLISAEDYGVLEEGFRPVLSPEGDAAVLTKAYADQNGYAAGDYITVTIDGFERRLKVAALCRSAVNGIYFDCEYNGFYHNAVAVTGDGSVDGGQLKINISAATATDMATVMTPRELLKEKTTLLDVFITGGNLLFACLAIFSLIGISDNMYESYRARRGEFALYAACGMNGRQSAAMKAFEVLMTAGMGVLSGALMAGMLLPLVNQWMLAYGVDMFYLLSL